MTERHGGGGDPDSRPYESLYRLGNPTPPDRTDPGWARHSGIHHDPADSPEDDRYAWLFRSEDASEEAAPVGSDPGTNTPGVPGPVEEDTRTRIRPVPGGTAPAVTATSGAGSSGAGSSGAGSSGAGSPIVNPAPGAPASSARSAATGPETARRRRWPVVLLLVVVVGLLVGAGVWFVRGGLGGAAGSPTTPSSGSPSGSASSSPSGSDDAYQGAVTPVRPTAITADCTAPDATDDGGNKVTYGADQALDGDPSTAWRCNGAGTDEQVVFDLPAGTTVAELGIVNGYTKIDPTSRKHRYGEYRRILTVTWTVGSRDVTQSLSGTDEKIQTVRIPPTKADEVVLTITTSSKPGSKTATRNAVLISEASLGSPA